MDQFEQIYQLIQYAFNKPNTTERYQAFQLLYDHSLIFKNSTNNTISHHLLATPFKMRLFNQEIPITGVGYVATLPEYRGGGGIRQLFDNLFQTLSLENIPVSFLAPFSQTFYRQFGYENVCQHWVYTFNKELFAFLPKTKEGKYERQILNNAVLAKIQSIYETSLAMQNGSLQREEWWYQYKTLKYPNNTYVVFYSHCHKDSYMIYHMDGDTFFIDELAYTTKEQLIALLNFAKSHQMTFNKFKLETANRHLEQIFTDTRLLHVESYPYMMACIHDLKSILKICSKNMQYNNPCYIEITNSNQKGIWEISNNNINYHASNDNLPINYSGTLQAFTPLFIGGASIHDLKFQSEAITCYEKHPWIEQWNQPSLKLYDYF